MQSQRWSKISDEVDKLFDMDESNIMKLVISQDELVGRDYVRPFTIDEISVFSLIIVEEL